MDFHCFSFCVVACDFLVPVHARVGEMVFARALSVLLLGRGCVLTIEEACPCNLDLVCLYITIKSASTVFAQTTSTMPACPCNSQLRLSSAMLCSLTLYYRRLFCCKPTMSQATTDIPR